MGQKTGKFKTDMFFGLMYFRGILGVNLHINDTLFLNDSYFFFGAIMSKTISDFSKTIFVLTTHKKERSCKKQKDSQLLEKCGKSSIQIFKSMMHHRNIFQLMRHYTQ